MAALYESLQSDDAKGEAAEVFRTLVDQVTLMPEAEELAIVLRGDLAAILPVCGRQKEPRRPFGSRGSERLASQASVVAGIGFEPMTFRKVEVRFSSRCGRPYWLAGLQPD
ncbi:hypothetical protein [Bradyrhizobium sp. CCGE-LA001]|uniref:hypothetical protein n=1 Tax=Bradyrhizobium sp. CCGE-LA001 TaxID=1223566 RepID=UPI001F15B345|nr:hypothetical protein [Bradyrhizobium sp. CCGE-LA001]